MRNNIDRPDFSSKAAYPKILIVEDNPAFREFFKENLHIRFPSIDIFEAADGEKAKSIIEAESPDLIFMDIHLSGENGLELTKKIKKCRPRIVIVAVATYDLPSYRKAARRYGADRFFPKDALEWKEIEDLVQKFGLPHP